MQPRALALASADELLPARAPVTLTVVLETFLSAVDCAQATRVTHTDSARYLCRYFGADRPVGDFAGDAGAELLRRYIADETGGRERGLREQFGGSGNLARRLSYSSIRQRLCTLHHALKAAVARGDLASMPPWPIPPRGSHGHLDRGKYLLPAQERAERNRPRRARRAMPICRADGAEGPAPAGAATLTTLFEPGVVKSGRRISPVTVAFRREHLTALVRFFGDRAIADFAGPPGYRLIRAFVDAEGPDGRGVKYATLRKQLTTLRLLMQEAIRRGDLLALPPWPNLPSDGAPRRAYLTPHDYEAVRNFIPDHRRIWLDLGVFTGQHSSDLHTMTWAMVDLGAGPGAGPGPGAAFWLRRNTKNRKAPAWLPMPEKLRERLTEEWRGRTTRPSPEDCIGGRWDKNNCRRQLKRACWKAGIPPVSPIDLRRTCATWLLEGGARKEAIREWLGHSVTSEMVERHYAQITPALVGDMVEAMNRTARAGTREPARRSLPPAGDP